MRIKLFVVLVVGILSSVSSYCSDPFWAQATFVRGDVKVKPSGSNSVVELKLGEVLHRGDTVMTSEKSRASFLLSDGSIKAIGENSTVVLSSEKEAANTSLKTVAQNLSKSLLSREGNNPMLKHLGGLRGEERYIAVGPNKTKVHADSLRLSWVPVPGVSRYFVTLMGPGDMLYETAVENTYIDIPKEKITAGTTYYWEIRNASEKDSMTALGAASFTTLDKKEALDVKTLEENINSVQRSSEAQADSSLSFLLYQVYRGHGMDYDAVLMLEKILSAEKDNPEILKLKKELCKTLGISESDISRLHPR
jgi:hypothetical protein